MCGSLENANYMVIMCPDTPRPMGWDLGQDG